MSQEDAPNLSRDLLDQYNNEDYYECEICGYVVSGLELNLIKCVWMCPRCGEIGEAKGIINEPR